MYNYYNAILHIDGDAFFASCEQATTPQLRGKPIAVGYERGAATAYSYEAKRLGVTRGISIKELQAEYPEVLLVSSDYKKYALYSNRMKSIVSEFTHTIEKTSIDECYADITGLDVKMNMSYLEIARAVQDRLCQALGITFSIGIGPTKTLAKIGSAMNKPHGITCLNKKYLNSDLYKLPISYVPGIGYQTTPKMHQYGIKTIQDFVQRETAWVDDKFSKPYVELHKELSCKRVALFETQKKVPKSISKIHAFKTLTDDDDFLLAELSRHCEVIARKLRYVQRGAMKIRCGLKDFDSMYISREHSFAAPTSDPQELFKVVSSLMQECKQVGKKYRATYVSVSKLQEPSVQVSLFESEDSKLKDAQKVISVIDSLDRKYGAGSITRASSAINKRDRQTNNATPLLYNRSGQKVLWLPYWGYCE